MWKNSSNSHKAQSERLVKTTKNLTLASISTSRQRKFETFVNDQLKPDLRFVLEGRDKVYSEIFGRRENLTERWLLCPSSQIEDSFSPVAIALHVKNVLNLCFDQLLPTFWTFMDARQAAATVGAV